MRINQLSTQIGENTWDRRCHESAKAFQAFTLYRDLSERRTYQKVAEQLRCNGSNIRRWSTRWSWYERARQWDVYQDQIAQEAHSRERREMAERQASIGVELQRIAQIELAKLRKKLQNGIRDEKTGGTTDFSLSPREIARLAEVGSTLERRSYSDNHKDKDQVAKNEVFFGDADDQPET